MKARVNDPGLLLCCGVVANELGCSRIDMGHYELARAVAGSCFGQQAAITGNGKACSSGIFHSVYPVSPKTTRKVHCAQLICPFSRAFGVSGDCSWGFRLQICDNLSLRNPLIGISHTIFGSCIARNVLSRHFHACRSTQMRLLPCCGRRRATSGCCGQRRFWGIMLIWNT